MVDDGGPAFPWEQFPDGLSSRDHDQASVKRYPGMDLRDYFAAHALTGILASITERWHANDWLAAARKSNMEPAQLVAISAYERADAMLEVREKNDDE